jgi:glycosidase
MREFIFGSLGLQEQRDAFVQNLNKGIKHLNRLQPLAPGSLDTPEILVTVGQDTPVRKIICQILKPEPLEIELSCQQIEWHTLNWAYTQQWKAALPAFPEGTIVRYTIKAYPQDGRPPISPDDGAIFSYLVGSPTPPQWSKSAIIYQVFPDRFHPGDNQWNLSDDLDDIFGGTLRGIIQKLDYIADLGFNCIWLNPFFPDDTHHGYHATDYFTVNPRLGTAEDLHQLVQKAHRLGIRLLLDFVANHWGSGHKTFQAALKDQQSEYYPWYTWIDWPNDYETFFGVMDLPKINVNHRPARDHLLKAAVYWLKEFDFDGFRLDYAMGVPLDFWTEFRAVVKAAKPDAWIFGEATEPPAGQLKYWGRLDGNLDFLMQQAFRNTFAFDEMTLTEFDAFLNLHEPFFPKAYSRPSFLDNHDINRFLWLVEGDNRRLKLAALCQFTLSGPPIVYYGAEVGLSQERDMFQDERHIMAEARLPMLWGDEQDRELWAYYRWLIHLRRDHPVLWNGRRQTIHLNQTTNTYAYARSNDQETITVALNLSDQPRTVKTADHTFTLPPYTGEVSTKKS